MRRRQRHLGTRRGEQPHQSLEIRHSGCHVFGAQHFRLTTTAWSSSAMTVHHLPELPLHFHMFPPNGLVLRGGRFLARSGIIGFVIILAHPSAHALLAQLWYTLRL